METPKTIKGNGMATYLWVGKNFTYPTAEVNTAQQRLDKYSFNAPGNWYTLGTSGGISTWVPTNNVPGVLGSSGSSGGDIVFVGNPVYGGLSASFYPGWTAAKCPLLFGGYSGGDGAGTWHNTSAGATGTTWSSSLSVFAADLSTGWNFNVPLGAGLTGWALNWAIEMDTLYGATWAATTSADYVTAVGSGFRNPANPLRLKVAGKISFVDNVPAWGTTPSVFKNSVTERPTAVNVADPAPVPSMYFTEFAHGYEEEPVFTFLPTGASYSDRGFVFDGVKAFTQVFLTGFTRSSEVQTILDFQSGLGQDLTVNGGSYKTINLNTNIVAKMNTGPWDDWTTNTDAGPVSGAYKHGVLSLNNATIRELNYAKCGTVMINGGTAAKVNVQQFPYCCKRLTGYEVENNSFGNHYRYWDELPTYITCGFSGGYVWSDQYSGITVSIPTDFKGTLNLTNKSIQVFGDNVVWIYNPSIGAIYNPGLSGQFIGNLQFDDRYTATISAFDDITRPSTTVWKYYNHWTDRTKQRVYVGGVGDSNGYAGGYIPVVNIDSTHPAGGFKWIPWELKFNKPVSTTNISQMKIDTINNNAGYVRFDPHTLLECTIGQIYLSNYARVHLWGIGEPSIPDAYASKMLRLNIGGLTGASGDVLQGGIVMSDGTGRVRGVADTMLYDTQILPDGTNRRAKAGVTLPWLEISSGVIPSQVKPFNQFI
jgi:hypothetical protein